MPRRRSSEGEGVGGCGRDAAVECNGGADRNGWDCNAALGGPGWRWSGLPTSLGTAGLTVRDRETCGQLGGRKAGAKGLEVSEIG